MPEYGLPTAYYDKKSGNPLLEASRVINWEPEQHWQRVKIRISHLAPNDSMTSPKPGYGYIYGITPDFTDVVIHTVDTKDYKTYHECIYSSTLDYYLANVTPYENSKVNQEWYIEVYSYNNWMTYDLFKNLILENIQNKLINELDFDSDELEEPLPPLPVATNCCPDPLYDTVEHPV
jgi:hypothetical protein